MDVFFSFFLSFSLAACLNVWHIDRENEGPVYPAALRSFSLHGSPFVCARVGFSFDAIQKKKKKDEKMMPECAHTSTHRVYTLKGETKKRWTRSYLFRGGIHSCSMQQRKKEEIVWLGLLRISSPWAHFLNFCFTSASPLDIEMKETVK